MYIHALFNYNVYFVLYFFKIIKIQFNSLFFFFSEERVPTVSPTFLTTIVDYQLFIIMGSNEPIYHWKMKRNKEKKMKLYGIQILGNKGTFKILCWIVPSLYSFKSHPSHPLLFYHCEQNATTRNKCTSEFCSGWVISYILLEATHLSTHFSFTIVNKMQML